MGKKQIQVDESVYQELVKVQGQLMSESGEQLSLSQTIEKLIENRKGV
jgi:predicted CopG family antitoxin